MGTLSAAISVADRVDAAVENWEVSVTSRDAEIVPESPRALAVIASAADSNRVAVSLQSARMASW